MSQDRIKVLCRIRPFPDSDDDDGFKWSDRRIVPLARDGRNDTRVDKGYLFQRVLPPEARNEHVFDEMADAVAGAAEGVNATVLAYGHTSAGKTHTMVGTPDEPGLIMRSMEALLALLDGKPATITVSYFEVYMEKVYDLLSGDRDRELDVTGSDENVAVGGLVTVDITGIQDCAQVLAAGNENRRRTRTNLNEHSSRSHTIFQADIKVLSDKVRHSQLRMVDLAGSECSKTAGTSAGTQREGAAINKSLLALTNVIYSLASANKGNQQHVPYRDAKLTRILQNSLGGNSSTRIICCVGAKAHCYEETLSTLMFADRARVVFNTVKRNESNGTCSVPWGAMQEVIAMYHCELDRAEAREAALRDAHKRELYTTVTFMLKEHNAEGLLWRELDYVAQKKCEALTSDVHRAMKLRDTEVRAEAKKYRERMERERANFNETEKTLNEKIAELQQAATSAANVKRAREGEMSDKTSIIEQLQNQNIALRQNLQEVESKLAVQTDAHLKELLQFQASQQEHDSRVANEQQAVKEEGQRQLQRLEQAVAEKDRHIAHLVQQLDEAKHQVVTPAQTCLVSATSSMASIPLGTARGGGGDLMLDAASHNTTPPTPPLADGQGTVVLTQSAFQSIKRKLSELQGCNEHVRVSLKRSRLSNDPAVMPPAVKAFDEAVLAAMPKARVVSQSACLPQRRAGLDERAGASSKRVPTPSKRDATPVKSRARAMTPTSEKRSHTPKSVARGRYGTPVRTPSGKLLTEDRDARPRRVLEPRGQAAATPPAQRHPTPTSSKKTLFSTGDVVRKRTPPRSKRRVSPPPHERHEVTYPF